MNAQEIFDSSKSFAVIGASTNPEKFGHVIYKTLLSKNLKVYPVNPKHENLLGNKCYSNIEDLPEKVDLLIFVVPPAISLKVTLQALANGYSTYWYQPGSYNADVINLHVGKNTKVVNQDCLLQLN